MAIRAGHATDVDLTVCVWQPFVKAAIYTRQNLAAEKYEGRGGDERFLSKRNARRVGSERATEYVGWAIVRNRTKHRRSPTKRFQLERSNANLLPLLRYRRCRCCC